MKSYLSLACAAGALGLGLLTANPSLAQSQGALTFDEALKAAQLSAPSLAAKTAGIQAARSLVTAAGRLPDPKLRAGMENFPISGPPAGSFNADSMTMATVGVMQDVPNAAKRKAARDKASADVVVASADALNEGRNVRINTALAWIDLYYAERKLKALDEIAPAIESISKSAPSQLASGSIRPAQSLEADQLSADLADRRADLVADIAKARSELIRWTGDDTADVAGDPPDYTIDSAALRAALDDNPTLATYAAMSRRAEADVAVARADKRPDWGWDVTYQHRDPRWGDMVSAGVTLSLPLFQHTRQDPVIEAKADDVTKARLEQDAAHRELQAQLDADLGDHVMHHDRWMRAQTTLVPLAQKKADLEKASYAAGTASLTDVLEAQLALAEARVDALTREADAVRDGARITLTYGSDVQ